MKDFWEKVKSKGSKRVVENAVIFLILLVILIIVINSVYVSNESVEVVPTVVTNENLSTDTLEAKLEKILGMIEGVGKVNVMISYVNSAEKIPLYNASENTTVTEEKDKEGGTRKTETKNMQQDIIYEESGNVKQPFIKQISNPKIIGVIVVAEGANNLKVKENLINAVLATVDVPSHRIQVFNKNK